jgi:hypothetical protein
VPVDVGVEEDGAAVDQPRGRGEVALAEGEAADVGPAEQLAAVRGYLVLSDVERVGGDAALRRELVVSEEDARAAFLLGRGVGLRDPCRPGGPRSDVSA